MQTTLHQMIEMTGAKTFIPTLKICLWQEITRNVKIKKQQTEISWGV